MRDLFRELVGIGLADALSRDRYECEFEGRGAPELNKGGVRLYRKPTLFGDASRDWFVVAVESSR
jgi:hypothetical protein